MTLKTVRKLLRGTSGLVQLCILLRLNCGMPQQDSSDLQDQEVSWDDGTITRDHARDSGEVRQANPHS